VTLLDELTTSTPDTALDRFRTGALAAAVMDAGPEQLAARVDATVTRLCGGATVCLRVGNPLRAPLTLERILIQIAGAETDLVIDGDSGTLRRALAQRGSRILFVIEQAETLHPPVLLVLQQMLLTPASSMEVRVLLAGAPALHDLLHHCALAAKLGPIRNMLDLASPPDQPDQLFDPPELDEPELDAPEPAEAVPLPSAQPAVIAAPPPPAPIIPVPKQSQPWPVTDAALAASPEQAAARRLAVEGEAALAELRAKVSHDFHPIRPVRRRRSADRALFWVIASVGVLIVLAAAATTVLTWPRLLDLMGPEPFAHAEAVILRGGVRVQGGMAIAWREFLLWFGKAWAEFQLWVRSF